MELGLLIGEVFHLRDGPQRPLRDRWPADHVGERQEMFLDLWREPQQAHDLGHPSAGDALPASDGRLVGDLAGLEESLPRQGVAEELDHPGRPGYWGWPGRAPAGRGRGHGLSRGHPPRQGANTGGRERLPGSQADLNRLFAQLGPGSAIAALRDMQDPDVDLRRYFPSGSNTVTFGEQKKKERNSRVLLVSGRPRERELKGPFRNL